MEFQMEPHVRQVEMWIYFDIVEVGHNLQEAQIKLKILAASVETRDKYFFIIIMKHSMNDSAEIKLMHLRVGWCTNLYGLSHHFFFNILD